VSGNFLIAKKKKPAGISVDTFLKHLFLVMQLFARIGCFYRLVICIGSFA
jgi:hypothetical protein